MRVIAGSAKGISLYVPPSRLRPTMDKTRGAVFSALGDRLLNARVLDLFAGSGGFGIEALSRGASFAAFVDNHPQAIVAIKQNLAKTGLTGTVVRADAFRFLQDSNEKFDLVFADPPYSKKPGQRNFGDELLNSQFLARTLTPDGIFILERYENSAMKPGWQILRSKRYGDTEVLFLAAT
jgi:16S rRNA (guanine966-N2)-methyltransferase